MQISYAVQNSNCKWPTNMLHPTNPNHLSHTTKWPERWRPWTQEKATDLDGIQAEHLKAALPPSSPSWLPSSGFRLPGCPTQHEDREENTTRKEGQIQHHYEQPQRYNYHLNSGEDLRTQFEEQDRAPASVSPPIRIHRGPLPPNGRPLSHGIHIRSQSKQVLPGSGHTWFRESIQCGFSSHPLPGPIQKGYCPRHMACSEGHVRRPQRNSMLEKHIQQKIHNRTGVGQGKLLSPLLYKVYADNLLQKLCKACSTSISHALKNDGTPYTP